MRETASPFQGRGGRGQQDLSSDLTPIHLTRVRLGVHWKDIQKMSLLELVFEELVPAVQSNSTRLLSLFTVDLHSPLIA